MTVYEKSGDFSVFKLETDVFFEKAKWCLTNM